MVATAVFIFSPFISFSLSVNAQLDQCDRFLDVPESYEFYGYICKLRHYGVVEAYPGNVYKPENYVTRGEMSKFIFLGSSSPANTTCGGFPDVPYNAPFYTEITSLKCSNIVSGCPQIDGSFLYKPNNNVSRGEMVKFVKNAFGIQTDTSCGNFPDVPVGAPFYQEITSLKCAGSTK